MSYATTIYDLDDYRGLNESLLCIDDDAVAWGRADFAGLPAAALPGMSDRLVQARQALGGDWLVHIHDQVDGFKVRLRQRTPPPSHATPQAYIDLLKAVAGYIARFATWGGSD